MNGTRDIVFKRCGCTDEATGRQLAGRCPHLAEPGHGGRRERPADDRIGEDLAVTQRHHL
jgi:hypothetical protein